MDLRTRTVLRTASASVDEGTNSTPHELVMTWAHDSITGQPLYIMELGAGRNGNMCGCECASCGQPLKAVNAGKKRGTYIQKPHFKHQAGSVKSTCMVLAARAAALRLLLEDGMLDLPARTISRSWTGLSGATYNGEATTPRQRLSVVGEKFYDRTSAFLQLDDGRRVLVRLTGTNEAPPELEEDDVAYATVFLDINDPAMASLDPSELRTRLKLLPETLCWQSHWDDVDLEKRAEIAALEQAQDGLDWTDEDFLDLETLPAELRRETLLHLTVKQLLSEAQQIRVPELVVHETTGLGQANAAASKVLVAEQVMRLSNVRLEQRVGCVIPDVCADCFSQNGQPLGLMCIEVTVTNGFSEERMDRVRTVGMLTLEVDLRNAYGRISRIDLGKVVVDGVLGKRWIHHPDIERCRQDLLEATRDFKPKPD